MRSFDERKKIEDCFNRQNEQMATIHKLMHYEAGARRRPDAHAYRGSGSLELSGTAADEIKEKIEPQLKAIKKIFLDELKKMDGKPIAITRKIYSGADLIDMMREDSDPTSASASNPVDNYKEDDKLTGNIFHSTVDGKSVFTMIYEEFGGYADDFEGPIMSIAFRELIDLVKEIGLRLTPDIVDAEALVNRMIDNFHISTDKWAFDAGQYGYSGSAVSSTANRTAAYERHIKLEQPLGYCLKENLISPIILNKCFESLLQKWVRPGLTKSNLSNQKSDLEKLYQFYKAGARSNNMMNVQVQGNILSLLNYSDELSTSFPKERISVLKAMVTEWQQVELKSESLTLPAASSSSSSSSSELIRKLAVSSAGFRVQVEGRDSKEASDVSTVAGATSTPTVTTTIEPDTTVSKSLSLPSSSSPVVTTPSVDPTPPGGASFRS